MGIGTGAGTITRGGTYTGEGGTQTGEGGMTTVAEPYTPPGIGA